MSQRVAYCGLVCSDCSAYLATQANDPVALERVAAQWREEYHAPGITAASVRCDGCQGTVGFKGSHCCECEIRACGVARGVETCAACESYPCSQLERFWGFAPDARAVLDGLRA